MGEIKAPGLLAVLRSAGKRGHDKTARRLRSTCGQVFRYAIATGRADRDVSADLRDTLIVPKVPHCAAITSTSRRSAQLPILLTGEREGHDKRHLRSSDRLDL
ncbi:MAG: phage integrase central domain-containing protein [Novosphingobium sp.]